MSGRITAAELLLTHARLEAEGYRLRTLRFDTKPHAAGQIMVGMVWRRRWDRAAMVRNSTLSRQTAHELLLGLGSLAGL